MKLKSIVQLLIGILIIMCAPQAFALKISNLYFIGDSLSDQGNCDLSLFFIKFEIPPPVTSPGGNTYAYYLANQLGFSAIPSNRGGNDYACVAAATNFVPSPAILFSNLIDTGTEQIQQLVAQKPISHDDLFIYWLGADDIILAPPIEAPFPFGEGIYPAFNAVISVSNVIHGLATLVAHGAHYLVVINDPVLNRTPAAIAETDPVKKAAYRDEPIAFNNELLNRINNSDLNVVQVDLYSAMNYLLDHAAEFGYTNITQGCSSTSDPNATCSTYFYWDDVHPTDKTHRIIAQFIGEILTSPDFFATLAEVPLSLVHSQLGIFWQQLYPQMPDHQIGKNYSFISASGNPYLYNNSPYFTASDQSYNGSLTVGLTRMVNAEWTIGAAIGETLNFTDYDQAGSQFKTADTQLSLFSGFAKGKFYLNSLLDYAHLHFWGIERRFMLGDVPFSADGTTNGNLFGGALQAGYNITNTDTLKVGPIVNLEYQYVDVQGYTESNADVFEVAFDHQNNDWLIGGAGLQATFAHCYYNLPVTTNAYIAINKQFLGDQRDVFFHQASLPAKFAGLPVDKPEFVFASAGINFATTFRNGVIGSLGYALNLNPGEIQSHTIMASLTMPIR